MKRLIYPAIALLLATGCKKNEPADASGIFETTTVTISAETSGRILSMAIEEGDSVMQGEIVAVVDTSLLVLQHKQIGRQMAAGESNSPDITAQVSALRSRIAQQRNELERQERLLADGATTQKLRDDAAAQLRTLEAELTAALSTLTKSRTSIGDNTMAMNYQAEQVGVQIERSIIVSPINGIVLAKYAEEGEFATPGKPLCKLGNMRNVYLRAYFTAGQLADIRPGQEVTVIADFGGEERFEYAGKISWIAEESEFTPKSIQTADSRSNLVYAVKIRVDNNDGRIKLGQYGEVRLRK